MNGKKPPWAKAINFAESLFAVVSVTLAIGLERSRLEFLLLFRNSSCRRSPARFHRSRVICSSTVRDEDWPLMH